MQGATDGDGELRRESSLREDGTQGQRSDLWQQTLQVGSEMCQVVRFALLAGRPAIPEGRPFACFIDVPYLAGFGEYTGRYSQVGGILLMSLLAIARVSV